MPLCSGAMSTTIDEDLRAAATAWIAADPDPHTRAELQGLLDGEDEAALRDRMGPGLSFGTAGIRGPVGAGPARMNRAVVRRVTAGLATVLRDHVPGAGERGVVVGCDARRGSHAFADDAARVLAGAGIAVHRLPGCVPTPLVAFAVRHLGAAAGVQITASHNPPSDNGYKVYWEDGAQIIPPVDAMIAEGIDAAGRASDIPLAAEGVTTLDDAVAAAYREACLACSLDGGAREVRLVYTPLHGVAGAVAGDVFRRAGFADVHVVAEQAEPDPEFPTTPFPNPEVPGALDRALALAGEVEADVVLAHDPDGDRIAVAAPGRDGAWRMLSGDEAGCLVADYLLANGPGGPERVVATTVVSSQMLARIADHHGVEYAETLTGFKWLARVAGDAEQQGRRFVSAYEQALGIMVGAAVRDKDGISAGLVLAELAARLKASGLTFDDALDELAWRHGVHATTERSVRLDGPGGPEIVDGVLDRLRTAPPDELAGVAVTAVTDHAAGVRRHTDGAIDELPTPPTQLVALQLADGSRAQVRPSGTEPLLKFYVEVVEPVAGDVGAARQNADRRLAALAEAFTSLV